MSHYFLLNFIQRFSFLQQYLIILSISFILLLIFNHWWYILLLPLSTIFANFSIKRLCHSNQSPYKFSGYIYNLLIRKRSYKQDDNINETIDIYNSYETTIHKEYDTYIRTIIARYICVWYYPLISTDQEFPEDLMIIFHIILNRLNDQLKLLKSYDIIRLIINLKQQHMKEYLRAYDSYRKQRKPNRLSKSLVEEFSQINSLHRSLINNDIHIYLKALVELLLTNLIPEPVQIYSGSRTGREFLTQIIVNCIFLPLFNQFSKPRMIYYLIILLWETEEQKKSFEINENSLEKQLETNTNQNENEPIIITENLTNQQNHDDEHRSTRLEHIIYSATIISSDTAYDSMFGAAYTVYLIQCETKSPFTSDATHRYTVPRRFREFINLHKRLQQNHITSRHCYDIDEVFRTLPTPIDNMNPDVIRRRKHILEQYIQKLISNEVLNCSHDVLEFFAFNSDPNIPFGILPSKLSVPRVDRVLLRTLSDMGNRLNRLRSTKREMAPLHETFQLNISTTYENTSSTLEQLKFYIHQSSFRCPSSLVQLHSTDSTFLQTLLTRSSIATSRRNKIIHSDIPLTDAVLDLLHICLHSSDAIISYQSIHQILRTVFGHFIEEFLKNQIDDIFSRENILMYLIDLRTKVLWPDDDNNTVIPMKNVKHRAYNACMNQIPNWLQYIVGKENIRCIIMNVLECLSHEQLNKHFICNLFDLFIELLIPNIATEDFLTKYVQMHAGNRS
ncbi:unnamed protein product [Rotaria sp. Silwood1]|nr:unnamed protein product [Rotaria sp. Silwood1]CAF1112255.1 unnamed protein product [Rotaria sp. Silwood1]CAF4788210.1 unnamed protein product [Rotaria sp. Silwood1]